MPDVLAAIHARSGQDAPPRRRASDDTLRVTATLVSVDSTKYVATIGVLGSEQISNVPCVPSTYTGVTAVHVLMQGGKPVLVAGPATTAVLATPAPAPPTVTTRTVTSKVIAPAGSGTYRADRAAWARWNDPTDPYQGTSFSGAGPMYGLAWYDYQIVSLGATAITRATLRLVSNGSPGAGDWTAVIQACGSGGQPAGAPTFIGDTFSVTIPSGDGGVATVDLPASVRENLRTGVAASLGFPSVGAAYGGTHGGPSSWTLDLDYEVTG